MATRGGVRKQHFSVYSISGKAAECGWRDAFFDVVWFVSTSISISPNRRGRGWSEHDTFGEHGACWNIV